MEEDKDLNMDLFSEPSIDMGGNEDLDFLLDGGEDILGNTPDDDVEPKEGDDNNDDNTNEDDNPEEVVGENIDDDTEGNEPTDDDVDNDSSSNSNLFNSLATLLSEEGLISSVESELNDVNDFVDLFRKEIKKSEYNDLNDLQTEYLNKLREGIPHEKIVNDQQEMDKFDQITDEMIKEDSNLRQRIIYQDFVNKGYSDERARKYLQRSIDTEQDLEDAVEAFESIKEHNKERIELENKRIIEQQEAYRKAEEKRINNMKKKIQSSTEVIKNFPVTSAIKEKVEKNMFDIVSTDPDTNRSENALMKYRRENPEDFDFKLYYLFTISNGFQDFDSIVKKTKSTAMKDLERAFKSNTRIKDPGSPAYLQDPDSYSVDIAGHDIVVD